MSAVVGTVSFLSGMVYAIQADGTQRLLMLGDEVFADEVIKTGPDAQVGITMANGNLVSLSGGQSWFVGAETYTEVKDYPVEDAVATDDIASVDAIQQAILAGVDPTQVTEATAAGNAAAAGGADGNEGSSFEMISRTAAEADPEAGYETIGLNATQNETVFLSEDESAVRPLLRIADVTVDEDAGVMTMTITLSSPATGDVTFNYQSSNNSALSGSDYDSVFGEATIPAGATSVTLTIPIIDDAFAEDPESFLMTITNVSDNVIVEDGEAVGTILDEADASEEDTANFTLTGDAQVEEGGVASYTLSVDIAPETDVTATVQTGNITTDDGDYVPVFTTVTIPAGSTSVDFTVNTNLDDEVEGNETFSVTVSSITGGGFENIAIDTPQVETVIVEPVAPPPTPTTAVVSITGPGSVIEGETTTDYTVTISEPPTAPVIVNFSYTTTDADGNDYVAVNSVVIPAGQTSVTFTIDTIDDAIAEGSEDFTVAIQNVVGGGSVDLSVSGSAGEVTTSIVDETVSGPEDTALVSITGAQSITEGDTSAPFTVSVNQPAGDVTSPITVSLVYTGVAVDGTDFTGVAEVTIPAGSNSIDFTVDTLADSLVEGSESLIITIGSINDTNFENIEADPSAESVSSSIVESSGVQISVNDVTVNEDAGSMTFTVTLSNPSTSPVTVDYATQDGTATAGFDYGAVSGTLTFAPGVTSLTVTIPVADDFIAEGGETLDLVLSNPTNATITDDVGLGIIQDEPTPGPADTINVTLSGPATVAEGATATYTVTLSAAAITDMVVDVVTGHVTTDNGDLVPVTQQVTIAAGTTTATLDVTNIDDAYAEGAEDYTVTLTGSFGGGGFEAVNIDTTPVTTTINDNSPTNPGVEPDAEVINITLTGDSDVAEGGTATYTIHFDQPTATPMDIEVVTGHITTEDGDLVPTTFTVTVPAGVTSHDFTVSNNDDNLEEGDEDYSVALTGVTSGGGFETVNVDTTPASSTIVDDETLSIRVNDVTVNEDAGILTFTVSLSVPTTADVTFDYATADNGSALAGSDYTAVSGSATIPAGSTQVTIDVPITDDVYLENPETFLINLTNISSGVVVSDAQGQGAILDDSSTSPETSTLTLTSTPSVQEGGTITYTVDVDNAPVGSPLVVTLDNGAIITIPVGATTGSVDVTAPDDVYVDPDTDIVVGITSATGGEYEALDTSDTTTTVLSDDSDTTTVTLEATPAVEEGGTITYTATVDNAPEDTPLVITLDNGATITIPVGGTTGSVDVTAPDDVYVDPDSDIVVGISSTTGGNYENVDITDTATTVLSDDSDLTTLSLSGATTVAEGGDATYTLTLSNPAETDMTVDVVTG
ncbi:retention module-containing protein, partial [Neptunomonas concharum]